MDFVVVVLSLSIHMLNTLLQEAVIQELWWEENVCREDLQGGTTDEELVSGYGTQTGNSSYNRGLCVCVCVYVCVCVCVCVYVVCVYGVCVCCVVGGGGEEEREKVK